MRQYSRAVSRSLIFLISAAIVGGCAGGGDFQKPDKRPGGTGVVGEWSWYCGVGARQWDR